MNQSRQHIGEVQMKADIWMPLYIGDYLADTSRLTTEQHGAYLLLLMDYWKSGKLPDNNQVLSQITKLSIDAWSNARPMLEHFFSIEDGFWIQKRVEEEMVLAKQNKQKNIERATKAAKTRWNNATSNAPSISEAVLNECPSPSPSPSLNIKEKSATVVACPPDVDQQIWEDWKQLRKAKKAPVTQTVVDSARKEALIAEMEFSAFLSEWCARGSQGLKAEWIKPKNAIEQSNRANLIAGGY